MKPNFLASAIALVTGLSPLTLNMPAQAAFCPQVKSIVPPAKTTKEFRSQRLGITFQVPTNYRVMQLRGNAIGVMDANTYQEMQCLYRQRPDSDDIPDHVAIYTESITKDNQLAVENLRDYIAKNRQGKQFESITIAGQPALKYVGDGLNSYTGISFLSRDRKTLFTIATFLTEAKDSGFQSTFDLIRKTLAFKRVF